MLVNNVERQSCAQKTGKCYLKKIRLQFLRNKSILINHGHEPYSFELLNRQRIRNSVKRKAATDDIAVRPASLIYSEIKVKGKL